jgi:hypothetical protein
VAAEAGNNTFSLLDYNGVLYGPQKQCPGLDDVDICGNILGVPNTMTANSAATPQTVAINSVFGNALAVTLKDAGNNPIPGVNVTFTAPGSGASGKFSNNATTITVTTNGSGIASALFTSNATAGAYTVSATAVNLPTAQLALTNAVGPAASITLGAGSSPQTTNAGTGFANPFTVTVRDAGNNPIPGTNVAFTAPNSGPSGAFTSNNASKIIIATDAYGVVTTSFRANSVVGSYAVTVGSGGAHSTLSLTNQKGVPASMVAYPGTTPQFSWPSGFGYIYVTLTDASGNPVAGTNVTFTAPASGASCHFTNGATTIVAASNYLGLAGAWCNDSGVPSPGVPYQITAASPGLTPVSFTFTNNRTPSTMAAAAGSTPQTTLISTAFPSSLAVFIKDAYNNPMPGIIVTFTAVPAGGATGTFTRWNGAAYVAVPSITITTNSIGYAGSKFTANGAIGSYTVKATATGLTTQTFSLLNVGPPAVVKANPGTTPQTAPLNTLFPNPLSVTAEDAKGNPVPGTSVTFSVNYSQAIGPQCIFSNGTPKITVTTDSAGIASVPITANGLAGGYYVVAAATSGKTALIDLTNGGPPASLTVSPGSTPQTAPVKTQFAQPLTVTVKDANGDPIVRGAVTFAAPLTGASGTFSSATPPLSTGLGSITMLTNASGVASVMVTANGITGSYTVTATTGTGGLNATFSLTN